MSPHDHIESLPSQFQALWRETERHVARLRAWDDYSVQTDDWIYIGVLKRAGELVGAISQLLALENFAACTIIDRVLMELKFRASWLSEDSDRKRLAEYAGMIESEHSILIRKMEEGKSLSSQVLNHFFGSGVGGTSKRDDPRRSSVFKLAEQADLAFDYDIPYWTESLYIHSHPLSLAMYRPKSSSPSAPFADALIEIASGQKIPFQLYGGVPSTFAWILDYIMKCFAHPIPKSDIESLRKLIDETMNQATGGMWMKNAEMPPGSLTIVSDEGKTVFQRKQRRA